MNRIPFVAAVVGALLVGGATTGTTHARWTDQATLPASSVMAGYMKFMADQDKTQVALNKTTSTSDNVQVVVTDESAGKNLVQKITPTLTATAGVTATLRQSDGTSCGAADANPVNLTPGGVMKRCIAIAVDPATSLSSATVKLELEGTQAPAGWTSPGQTLTVNVSIAQPNVAPGAPSVSCHQNSGPNGNRILWTPTGTGTTSYRVYQALGAGSFDSGTAVSASPYNVAGMNVGDVVHVKITALNAASAESAASVTATVTRIADQGSARYTCTTPPVTP